MTGSDNSSLSPYSVGVTPSPDFSPGRWLLSETYLLSISYGNILNIPPLQTALDAFIAPIPGRNPTGGYRRANRLSCRFVSLVFVPPAGTCSLRPSLGATQRAAVAVQIVCPDDLSLNRSYGYAFGPQAPAGGTNLPGADLDARRAPAGGAPGKAHI